MQFSMPDAELLGTPDSDTDKTNPNKTGNKANFTHALTTSITNKVILPLKEREQAPSRLNFIPHNPASRVSSRGYRKRVQGHQDAVTFAQQIGYPLNLTLTIAWAALMDAGQRNEGHILAFDDKYRCALLRKRWARLARRLGFSFTCIWGRAVGPRQGVHIHALFWWPREAIGSLRDFIETMTGSHVIEVSLTGVAQSECGGWRMVPNTRGIWGAIDYADYIAGQDQRHASLQTLDGPCFGVSHTIGTTAQSKEGW